MNRGCMGSSVKGNRLSIPLLYANDYLCGTKMLNGVYEDEFAILPFESSLSDADLHRKAVSYAYQPAVVTAENGNMKDLTAAMLETQGGEVVLTALYPENGGIMARFCNYSDETATAQFRSDYAAVKSETDLLGNEISAVTDGNLTFRPWEIKTVYMK